MTSEPVAMTSLPAGSGDPASLFVMMELKMDCPLYMASVWDLGIQTLILTLARQAL